MLVLFFFFKQNTAYDMRISDWSSDVCSSDLRPPERPAPMDRLLSPNEAKFCLMDWGAPMNTVIVTRTAAPVDVDALRNSGFRLPITVLDRNRRPRWAASDTVGVVEEEAATDWLAAAERLLDRRVGTEG